jgi:hypothetical protein
MHESREYDMTEAKGSFELAGWDETTYEELGDGGKLTRASVKQNFDGARSSAKARSSG